MAADIDRTESGRDLAALSARMVEVLDKIESAEKAAPEQKGTPLDELKNRRARKTAAPRASRAAVGDK